MGSVANRKLVRTKDRIASYNALDRADLPKGRRAAIEILILIGKPSSAATIRQYAEDQWGYKASEAENVRRRARQLESEGVLVEVAPDDGTGAPLWFPDHDKRADPPVPTRDAGPGGGRDLHGSVPVEEVPVHVPGRLGSRRLRRPR